jgi:hypothetical protein
MLSYWRNDAERDLAGRARHLLSKTYPGLRWLWVVGDCTDDGATLHGLRWTVADAGLLDRVTILTHTTGVQGEEVEERRRRISATMTYVYAWIGANIYTQPDLTLTHESDILSLPDIVERLVAHYRPGEVDVVGGWPLLGTGAGIFYDSWAYRADGQHFTNNPPHHPRHRYIGLVEVDSIGTVYLVPTIDLAGRVIERRCVVDLCAHLTAAGWRIWYDPQLVVVQRADLWVSTEFGEE